MSEPIEPAWIALDWGTSNLRAWALDADNTVLATASSPHGMGALERDGFEPALLALVGDWLSEGRTLPAIACGMVGARQGWVEADYIETPCPPVGGTLTRAPVRDNRISVSIVPGLCQREPADVMRGEETQIAGFLAQNPDFEGTLCLPGTHTKWARIGNGTVTDFVTVMSGEMFSLLSNRSVLRHSVASEGWNQAAFIEGLDLAMGAPERFSAALFSLRAQSLLADLPAIDARAHLSGLIVGMELAGTRAFWQDTPVGLIGATTLCRHYASALAHCGVNPEIHDGDDLTRTGLAHAYHLSRSATP